LTLFARKILILAREAGYKMEMEEINSDSFLPNKLMKNGGVEDFLNGLEEEESTMQKMYADAKAKDAKLKFVAQFKDGKAKTGLIEVTSEHPFYNIEGKDNIVLLSTERYGDALGLAVDYISDEVTAERTAEKGAKIISIEGAELPKDSDKNVLTVAANALLTKINADFGISFHIKKCVRPGSLASGSYHADNIAPALMGGITLISSNSPVIINHVPAPKELFLVGLFQHVTIKTSEARSAIPHEMSTRSAIKQAANFATLISGLHLEDFDLIQRSQADYIAEPFRKNLIPNFDLLKDTALATGAFSAGISGSGPTMYFMTKGEEKAKFVNSKLEEVLKSKGGSFESFYSRVSNQGVKIVD